MTHSISGGRFGRGARLALAGVVLLLSANDARAANPPSAAEQLFESARRDMKRGDFAGAREKLLESQQLEETVGTLFNLGLCEERLGRLHSALEHLRTAFARADQNDKRRPIMTSLIASLEVRVARVVLKRRKDASPALEITLDGRTVEATPDGQEVPVDPGRHEIVVRASGAPPRTAAIHVKEGETAVHVVAWEPATPPDVPAASTRSVVPVAGASLAASDRNQATQRLGAIAVNVGGAAVLAGTVLGFMTMGHKITADHHCTDTCDEAGLRASADGRSTSTASTALMVAGLASLGAGTYALLRDPAGGVRTTTQERYVGYAAGAVGLAALLASAIGGGVALAAKRELLERCGDDRACADPEGLDAAARGQTAATFSTVAFGVGVIGLGVASYSLLLRPHFARTTDVRLTLSPSAVACTATF